MRNQLIRCCQSDATSTANCNLDQFKHFPKVIFYVVWMLFSVFLISVSSAQDTRQNWPNFRNNGSGIASVNGIPTRWSPQKNVVWRSAIPGYGQSAPVVWGNTIYLTACDGPWQGYGYVHAFDLHSGKIIWTTKVPATTKVENYFRNSRAAPTCVVDENIVVSFFPGGDVTAMDHAGKTLWTVPLFKQHGAAENERGTASSLAQTKNLVFVVVDHHGPSYLVAIKKSDGSLAWKADRGKRVPSWSSPVIANLGEREIVIVSSADTVDAYDAAKGQLLWQVSDLSGNHIPSASVVGNSIYVGSTELAHGESDAEKVASSNCRIDLIEKDGKPDFQIRWGAERANSYYSSPLAFEGYVYYVNKSGILTCCDQESGKLHYRKRIGNPCWASAIGVKTIDGNSFIYFVMKNGFTLIIKPGKKFQQVARNQLWDLEQMQAAAKSAKEKRAANKAPASEVLPRKGPEKVFSGMPEEKLHQIFSYGDPTVYAAAVVDGNLLIRTGQHLYCIGEQ